MNEPKTIEEFLQRIEFLRLGIENELLRRKVNDILDQMIDMEDNYLNQNE